MNPAAAAVDLSRFIDRDFPELFGKSISDLKAIFLDLDDDDPQKAQTTLNDLGISEERFGNLKASLEILLNEENLANMKAQLLQGKLDVELTTPVATN